MPNPQLTEDQAHDLALYVVSLRKAKDKAAKRLQDPTSGPRRKPVALARRGAATVFAKTRAAAQIVQHGETVQGARGDRTSVSTSPAP